MRIKRNCQVCGKEFNIIPSKVKINGGKYCSSGCYHKSRIGKKSNRIYPKGKDAHNWKGGKIKKLCQICGKKFYVNPSKIKWGGGKCCSRKCRYKWHSQKTKGERIKRIITKCLLCSQIIKLTPGHIKGGEGKFCSRKCRGKWDSENRRGEKSYHWRGGTTSITARIRASDRYLYWRSQVFIRDDYICQKCNKRGGDLESHHIKSFKKLIEEVKKLLPLFPLYEGAMIYSPLWDIDNGMTLCIKCHNKTKGKKITK